MSTWLPILISVVSLLISGYGFWQQFISNKNLKTNCIMKLKEIERFYSDILVSLRKKDVEICAAATSKDPMFHMVDIEYANQTLRMLEGFKNSVLPLDVLIVKQITLINKLIKYEQKMDDCIVRHLIPNGQAMKEFMRPGDFSNMLNAIRLLEPEIKKYASNLNNEISKLNNKLKKC